MRFYDLMTLVWAALLAPTTGFAVYLLAGGPNGPGSAILLGGIATVGTAVLVFFWRMFKDPS